MCGAGGGGGAGGGETYSLVVQVCYARMLVVFLLVFFYSTLITFVTLLLRSEHLTNLDGCEFDFQFNFERMNYFNIPVLAIR